MAFLYWLESLRIPILNEFMLAVTYLGEKKTQNIEQKRYCNKVNEDLKTTTTNGVPRRTERGRESEE